MLEGLLGRGFSAKCKSLIKPTKSRIDGIRRKRNATQKFLKKDIADLLANGLDVNAYGRTEGLLVELNLSACYDFIEQSCDFVLKHLSVMQQQRECPEECREAISSLMYAAARFSDLPELRDLRQIFQERYGNALEYYMNQEFVENLTSKSSTLEKKVCLLDSIAREFSIKWNSRAFEQRMSKPSAFVQKTDGSNYVNDYNKPLFGKETTATRGEKHDNLFKRHDLPNNKLRYHHGKEAVFAERDDGFRLEPELSRNKFKPSNACDETIQKLDNHASPWEKRVGVAAQKNEKQDRRVGNLVKPVELGASSHGKYVEHLEVGSNLHNSTLCATPRRDIRDRVSHRKDFDPSQALPLRSDGNESVAANKYGDQHKFAASGGKVQEEETPQVKPYFNNAIPPPYVKHSFKQKDNIFKSNAVPSPSNYENYNGSIAKDPLIPGKTDVATSEKVQLGVSHPDLDRQVVGHASQSRHHHENELHDDNNPMGIPLPRPRSMRRRHSRSRSSHGELGNIAEDEVLTRKPRSRRRDDSRRGLQILFDDDRYRKDEEERIIDKLLIHYSKKPSTTEPGKVRKKSRSRHLHQRGTTNGASPEDGSWLEPNDQSEIVPPAPRSTSLPREQTGTSEVTKVFTRAVSFQPDRSNPARHVHPKLPDYDDLAAQFAALKGR